MIGSMAVVGDPPNPFNFHSTYELPPNASALLLYAHNKHILERDTAFCDIYSNIKNNTVHNLSSCLLSDVEKTVLSLGLKFLPTDKVNLQKNVFHFFTPPKKILFCEE